MPVKGWSKNPKYLGTDERGYPMWMGDCRHRVGGRNAKRCQKCYAKNRASTNYLGIVDGRQMYLAGCGHAAKRADAKRCKTCVSESAVTNNPYSKG